MLIGRLKGGVGSGFHGHKGRKGLVGGSVARGVLSAEIGKKFIVPRSAWYVDENAKPGDIRNYDYVQAWADGVVAHGWDIDAVIKKAHDSGVIPQGNSMHYDPDWGLTPNKVYEVWRTGTLDARPTGVYFGPSKDEIELYDEGKGDPYRSYKVILRNPKVYEDKNEAMLDLFPNCVSDATYERELREWRMWAGHGRDSEFKVRPHKWAIDRANYRGADVVEVNNKLDARIARALQKKGYDSMVLLDPELPCSREIMLLDPKKNLVSDD